MEFPSPHEHVLPDKIKCDSPPNFSSNSDVNRFIGSILGLAAGDALGASVEFRPHDYFIDHPVRDMKGGGTWGLQTGQWTDDTSMALCLASSLISKKGYDPYDQMVRYKWWYKYGYLSSTGNCFDIGNATRDSLDQFSHRQKILLRHFGCREEELDYLLWNEIEPLKSFDINCSSPGVAGNGALMRLAPVPLFFYKYPEIAVEYAGRSARLTHGDQKAVDACRYYAALIVAAIQNKSKKELLNNDFYKTHKHWFGSTGLHAEVLAVAQGSYKKKNGYKDGIRGKGYIVKALEAALWAFWSDENSFEKGALKAVNLGDDTDTTAAIYGQLAGAYYGYENLPKHWIEKVYARKLLTCIGGWLYHEGKQFDPTKKSQKMVSSVKTPIKISLDQQHDSNTLNTSTYTDPVVNPSDMYTTEIKYTPKSRSDKNESSLHRQDYRKTREYQLDNEQNPSHQSHISQQSADQQNISQSRRYYQLEKPYSLGYPHQPNPSYVQTSDGRYSSTPRRNNYEISRYGSSLDRSLNHTTDSRDHPAYRTNIRQSALHHSDVNQLNLLHNTNQMDTYGRALNSTSAYNNEHTLPRENRDFYNYYSSGTNVYSSQNNTRPRTELNNSRVTSARTYDQLTSTNSYNNRNRPSTSYDDNRQYLSSSIHRTNATGRYYPIGDDQTNYY